MELFDNSVTRKVEVFFYGLYMDPAVLEQKGVIPRNPRGAFVENFAVKIGKRVTLLRSPGRRAYGVVYSLSHEEINSLYWGAGIEAYRAEAVVAKLIPGGEVPALCCILSEPPAGDEQNPEYTEKLEALLNKLQLPSLTTNSGNRNTC